MKQFQFLDLLQKNIKLFSIIFYVLIFFTITFLFNLNVKKNMVTHYLSNFLMLTVLKKEQMLISEEPKLVI